MSGAEQGSELRHTAPAMGVLFALGLPPTTAANFQYLWQ